MTALTIVIVFSLGFCHLLFSGSDQWTASLLFRDIQVIVLVIYILNQLKWSDLFKKTLFFIFLFYAVFETYVFLVDEIVETSLYGNMYLSVVGIICLVFFYNFSKKYNYKSDTIEKDGNIYFCFWKPNKYLHFSSTLLGAPFGGMSIYINGYLYGFKWGYDFFTKRRFSSRAIQKKFFVINTGIRTNDIINQKLKLLVGAEAGFFRTRCIKVLRPVLREMGIKYYPTSLYCVPSIYLKKVLNGR